jgi:hypothetical protein
MRLVLFAWLAGITLLAVVVPCAAARMELQPDGPLPACAIEIEFRSRRGEIDMQTLNRVLRFVEAAPAIKHAYDERRGDDEPSALCLVIESETNAIAVFEQLTNIVPPQRARLPRLKPPPAVVLRYNGG